MCKRYAACWRMVGFHLSRVAQKELKAKACEKIGLLAKSQLASKKPAKKQMGGLAGAGSLVEKNHCLDAGTYSASLPQTLESMPSMAAAMARSSNGDGSKCGNGMYTNGFS